MEYEKTIKWFRKNHQRLDRYDGVIVLNNIPVGLIGLLSIDYKIGKAEYYILLGEKNIMDKGVAKEASKKILEYAFKTLKLNKVYLITDVNNIELKNYLNSRI